MERIAPPMKEMIMGYLRDKRRDLLMALKWMIVMEELSADHGYFRFLDYNISFPAWFFDRRLRRTFQYGDYLSIKDIRFLRTTTRGAHGCCLYIIRNSELLSYHRKCQLK